MQNALIVDDISEYNDTLEIYLEDRFTVFKATGMAEALDVLNSHAIALALVDIRLQEDDPANKDGIELVREIKRLHPGTAVIVMSAYREFDYAVEALNAGADHFMPKPVDPEELERIVAELSGTGRG